MIEVRRQPSTGQGDRRNRDRGPRGSLDRNGPDRNSNRGAYLWLRQLSCSGWPDVVFGCNGAKRLVWDRAAARTGSAKAAEDGSHIEEAGSAPTEEQRPAPLPEPSPPKCVTLLCTHVLVFHAFFGMFTVPDYHQSVMHRRPTYSRAPGPQQPAPAVPQSSWQPPTGRKTMADLFKQPPAPAAPLPTPAATHSVQESFSHQESAPISELVRLLSCLASPVITS